MNPPPPQRANFSVVAHLLLLEWSAEQWHVYLLRRCNTGLFDGRYAPPGGHVQTAEGVTRAACRECEEEAGVMVETSALALVATLPYRSDSAQGVNFVFATRHWRGEPVVAEPTHADDGRFFAIDALNALNALNANDAPPAPSVPWLVDVCGHLQTHAPSPEQFTDRVAPLYREYVT